MNEIWKDIEEYEGLYQVSNLGNVKSLSRKVKCRNNKYRTIKSISIKPIKMNNNYLFVNLWHNNRCTRKLLHIFVSSNLTKCSICLCDGIGIHVSLRS